MVLGISLNSRLIGLAIIKDQLLLDFKLFFFEEKWSKQKASKMLDTILQFVQEHTPNCIALMLPHDHHNTARTKHLINEIKCRCKENKIDLTCCQAKDILLLCPDAKAKKKALMNELVLQYPDLHALHRRELHNKKIHYHKVFEAVAVASIVANKNDNLNK